MYFLKYRNTLLKYRKADYIIEYVNTLFLKLQNEFLNKIIKEQVSYKGINN